VSPPKAALLALPPRLVDTFQERMFSLASSRREYSPEFKDEAVGLVVNTGRLRHERGRVASP
jgi:hypothetical protein